MAPEEVRVGEAAEPELLPPAGEVPVGAGKSAAPLGRGLGLADAEAPGPTSPA